MSMSLNQEFTPLKLLRFAAPSIIMMIFLSMYTIIDGMFVSRFVGSYALSATNIVYPVINIMIAFPPVAIFVAIAIIIFITDRSIIKKYVSLRKQRLSDHRRTDPAHGYYKAYTFSL